jgi:pectate lyase
VFTGSAPDPTASPTAGPTSTPGPPPLPGQPDGFASVAGFGLSGTTGGAAGPTVTVSTAAALAEYAGAPTPYTILVSGRISVGGMVTVVANKSIVGVGGTAEITGGGLQLGTTTRPGHNVIIRNIRFSGASDDSISVTNGAHHVWIDHNEFLPGYDGSLDIKRKSTYVTVSWNRFRGTDKSMLLGHSDGNGAQDTGYLRVTYHHNWMDGSNTRHPRVRFGYAHLFGNHVNVSDYFIGLGVEGKIYADANYMVRAKTITQDFGNASLTWTSSNYYNTATITRANDSGKTMADWLRIDNKVAAPPYSYSAGSASATPPAAGAGASGSESIPG